MEEPKNMIPQGEVMEDDQEDLASPENPDTDQEQAEGDIEQINEELTLTESLLENLEAQRDDLEGLAEEFKNKEVTEEQVKEIAKAQAELNSSLEGIKDLAKNVAMAVPALGAAVGALVHTYLYSPTNIADISIAASKGTACIGGTAVLLTAVAYGVSIYIEKRKAAKKVAEIKAQQ